MSFSAWLARSSVLLLSRHFWVIWFFLLCVSPSPQTILLQWMVFLWHEKPFNFISWLVIFIWAYDLCDVLQCLSYLFFACFRNEKNQLLLGIRRANRPQTVMPSSVLSSDSMHLGLLAAAAHAAATNSRFTIFYNPRYESLQTDDIKSFGFIASLNIYSTFHVGLAHQSSLFPWPSTSKQSIILAFLLGCVFECCLKQKNQVSAGRELSI